MPQIDPREAIQIDITELLDQLEDVVEKPRHIFNKAMGVDVDEFYALTNKIRSSLPEEVREASKITREANQIIDRAKDQAAQIIDQANADGAQIIENAKAEAARLVEGDEITRLATARAKEIIAATEEEARVTKNGADEYARQVLSDLEGSVAKVLSTIQHGRDRLRGKAGTGSSNE